MPGRVSARNTVVFMMWERDEHTIHPPRSCTKNKSPTIAGVTVSDAELPSPWRIRINSVVVYPVRNTPNIVAPLSMIVDKTRINRRP